MATGTSIDIHAHFFPEAYLALIAAEGAPFGVTCDLSDPQGAVLAGNGRDGTFLEKRFIDTDARLASMNEQGIEMHALSLTSPMVYWAGGVLGRRRSVAPPVASLQRRLRGGPRGPSRPAGGARHAAHAGPGARCRGAGAGS